MSGLKSDIKQWVKIHKTNDLKELYKLAKHHEKATELTIQRAKSSTIPSFPVQHNPRPPQPLEEQKSSNLSKFVPNNNNKSVVMDQRRAKGLCVYCGEKYGPGHKCLKRFMHMMQVWHEQEQEKEEGGGVIEPVLEEGQEEL